LGSEGAERSCLFVADGAPEPLVVVGYRGHEAMSAPFRYEVDLYVTGTSDELEAHLLGSPGSLIVGRGLEATRRISGWVERVELGGEHRRDGVSGWRVTVTIVPTLQLMAATRRSRVFQDMTLREIAQGVLDEWPVETEWRLDNRYVARDYCVQHQESDASFLRRLLASEGVFFFFEDAAPTDDARRVWGEAFGQFEAGQPLIADLWQELQHRSHAEPVMVFGDGSGAHRPGTITLRPAVAGSALTDATHRLTRFVRRRQLAPMRFRMRDYDARHARFDTLSERRAAPSTAASTALGMLAGAMPPGALGVPVAPSMPQAPAVPSGPRMPAAPPTPGIPAAPSAPGAPTAPTTPEIPAFPSPPGVPAVPALGALTPGAEASGAIASMEIYEYAPARAMRGEHDDQVASVALGQARRDAVRFLGSAGGAPLAVGETIEVAGQANPSLDGNYVVSAVDGGYAELGDAELEQAFEAVPHGSFLPPERFPPRRVHGLDCAMVVGPDNEDIHTDGLGRVRVQFRWDLDEPASDRRSCWMRVAQTWAGAQFGAHVLPRVGMEVLVGYYGGDVDRPVVIGCVPNNTTPAPFAMPGEAATTGWRTRSTPGGQGYNELAFHDQAGREQVRLRAQRDLQIEVLHHAEQRVEGDSSTSVGGEHTLRVEGAAHAQLRSDRHLTVGGANAVEVLGAERRVTHGRAEIRFEGGRSVHVAGESDVDVRGNAHHMVEGTRFDTVAGTHVTRVEGGRVAVVGTAAQQASDTTEVFGTHAVHAGRMVFEADSGLEFRCGSSVLTLTPDEVVLHTPSLRIEAEMLEGLVDETNVQGTSIRLAADSLVLLGDGAALALTDSAKLDGARVQLKAPVDAGDGPAAREPVPATVVRLVDQEGQPLANERFVLRQADGSERAGVLDADGQAEVHGLEGSWTLDFPGLREWRKR
jgi:type VI secretion system secreted protein VgrG